MKNKGTLLVIISIVAGGIFANCLSAQGSVQAGNTNKHLSSEKEQTQILQRLRGNGLCFTPNKGQIVDVDGNLRPDVLYKGQGAGADIYLRKTGVSYVYSNMGEVMHLVDEQVEELIKAGTITEVDEQKKKDELSR